MTTPPEEQLEPRSLEERVADLENLLRVAIAAARKNPAGRQVLRMLGLS